LPVTLIDTDLNTETQQGVHLDREHQLDDLENDSSFCQDDVITSIYLDPPVTVNPKVVEMIKSADKIVIPPGSPYGSIFPHLLVKGICEAIQNSKAKLILVLNLMTTKGQDHNLKEASLWLRIFQHYIGDKEWIKTHGKSRIDYLVANDNHIDLEILKIYQGQGQVLIEVDEENCRKLAPGMEIIKENITEYLTDAHLLRHNPLALAKTILELK